MKLLSEKENVVFKGFFVFFNFYSAHAVIEIVITRSKTTLKYWMMMEKYPYLKEEVGGLIPGST